MKDFCLDKKPFQQNYSHYLLEKIRISAGFSIPRHMLDNAEIDQELIVGGEQLRFQLETFLAGNKRDESRIKTISYPMNWWEYFKERFFPSILLKHFPVEYKNIRVPQTITITNICPHIEVPNDNKRHIEFCFCEKLKEREWEGDEKQVNQIR